MLCGDLGGTNSRLELFRVGAPEALSRASLEDVGRLRPVYRQTYKNAEEESFTAVLHQFLREAGCDVVLAAGCLAVAGHVENDRVDFTNNSWLIDARSLEDEFRMARGTLRLVNDFVANGYGVVTLQPGDYDDISPHGAVAATAGAPVACVGAGTGLGETFATAGADGLYDAWPSEGGHAAFAPRGDVQVDLLRHLTSKFHGRVSTERVVSGKGIVNVYEFLALRRPSEVDAALAARIHAAHEGAGVIAANAYDDDLCGDALDLVLDAYGAELGDSVVKWLPFGGLYIAGGIALKNVDRLRSADSAFMKAYLDRGRLSPVLDKVPLRLVTVDDLGLRGAHYVALATLVPRTGPDAPQRADAPPTDLARVASGLDDLASAVRKAALGLGLAAVLAVAMARRP